MSCRGGRQGQDRERGDSHAQARDAENPLKAAEILRPVELEGREVRFDLDRGGVNQAAARPEQERRRSGGGHCNDDRKRQPQTPHPSTL